MKLFNLFRHDFANGVLRCRYFAAAGLFLLPSLQMVNILASREETGTWIDFLFYVFKGMEPISFLNSMEQIRIPISWLLIIGGCLFLNLDYLLQDLTSAGQQVLVRCNSRKAWYLSKCFWNTTSCLVYFSVGIGMTLIVSLLAGAEIKLIDTPTISFDLLMLHNPVNLTSAQAICIALLLPLLTLVTINQIQMTLSLYVKPILSFLICISLLVIAVYASTPFAIGNGAMVIRSSYLSESGVDPGIACVVCIVAYLACVVLGTIRFKHTDILGIEE